MTDEKDTEKPGVFISYSHQDEDWKDRLKIQLKVLEQLGTLEVWDDRKIDPGGAWFEDIGKVMASAKAAICMISAPYLASDFCVKEEIPYLLQQMEEQGLILVPVLIRPCPWSEVPWLKRLQMIPRDGVTVASLEANEQDQVFSDLASKLNEMMRMVAEERQLAVSRDSKIGPKVGRASEYPALADQFIDIERLPVTGAELFGRQAELRMLDEAWEAETTNIVSLVAWGGVGKSTLLNKWVESLAANSYRGARRVFAWSFYSQGTSERVTSADEFISQALTFFGDANPSLGSPWAKGERLAELVGREKALLLLDGMEPLHDQYQGIKDPALARLIECLAERNDGLCVITTREPVKEFSDFPETTLQKNLEFLSPEAGRALLRVKGVRGSDAELEAASTAFGNHALAINLLASFLRDCEGRHIKHAAEIPDLADLDDPNHRHPRRVMAAFAERFGEGPELDLLHMMGLFDRPADGNCIAALREPAVPGLTEKLSKLDGAGWLKLLEKLRDCGLLAKTSHHDPDELDAHPLVREHFGERLRDAYENAWKAGHGRLYEHLKDVPKKHQPDTLVEMAPLFQAIQHGCQAERYQTVYDDIYQARLNRGWNYVVKGLGAHGSALGILSSFFERPWTKPTPFLNGDATSWLYLSVGHNLRAIGRAEEALLLFRKGMKFALAIDRVARACACASNVSNTYMFTGDLEQAKRFGKLGVEYADQSDNQSWKRTSRSVLAGAYHRIGDRDSALRLLKRADTLDEVDESGNPIPDASLSYNYCELLIDFDRLDDAERRAKTTLELGLKKNWIVEIALSSVNLSAIALRRQDFANAAIELEKAIDWLRSLGAVENTPQGLLVRAAFFRETKAYEQSRKDLDEIMRVANRYGMRLHECDAHLGYARLALAEGKPDDARTHLESAEALVSACGYHRRDGEVAELQKKLA